MPPPGYWVVCLQGSASFGRCTSGDRAFQMVQAKLQRVISCNKHNPADWFACQGRQRRVGASALVCGNLALEKSVETSVVAHCRRTKHCKGPSTNGAHFIEVKFATDGLKSFAAESGGSGLTAREGLVLETASIRPARAWTGTHFPFGEHPLEGMCWCCSGV